MDEEKRCLIQMSKGQIEKKVEYMQKSNPIMKGKIEQKNLYNGNKEGTNRKKRSNIEKKW